MKTITDKILKTEKVVWRYNRWHHEVDYSRFQNRFPEYIDGYVPNYGVNNEYNMKLVKKKKRT